MSDEAEVATKHCKNW